MSVQPHRLVDKPGYVFGRMLTIGVALHNAFVAVLNCVTEPAPQRATDTKVHRQLDDDCAGLASATSSEVYRPIDNDRAVKTSSKNSLNDSTN